MFIDEAGFYLLPGLVRTYAPRGETPVLSSFQTYDHLSIMSGVTMGGKLYTLVRDAALTSLEGVVFLKHVRRETKSKLLVIWDGSPIHRREVTTFMQNGGPSHIHLEQLPPYAPELNPDEGVWEQLKNVEMRNLSCKDLNHLRIELNLAINRLRSKPRLIQSFFAGAKLSIKS